MAYVAERCRLFGVSSDWLLLGEEGAREQAPVRCPGCGAVITGLDRYCPGCGRSLQAEGGTDTYSLVLIDPNRNTAAAYSALEQLSRAPYCAPEFPVCRRSQKELEALLFRAPVTLMWGLSAQRASEALSLFRAPGIAAVYRDSDGSSAEELIQSPKVPPQSLPTPVKEPMSFGATVGAVILGILAAVLILSFL